MNYLNVKNSFVLFQDALYNPAFVDKSLLIDEITHQMQIRQKYICITKPRRFGKTTNANMLGAYYTKGIDSSTLFQGLLIEKTEKYRQHLNQHNVIYIDFSRLPDDCENYKEYISNIKRKLRRDLIQAYPDSDTEDISSLADLLGQSGDSFIFILDEWDSIFYRKFMTDENKEDYLLFLKGLLKDQPYVEFAYMTGVLPIAKYSSGSELNMFAEYNFMNDQKFSRYFGFTEEEVRELCRKFPDISFEEIKEWYDGYYTGRGESLFNPRSVCLALNDGVCQSYWTQTGPMSEIADCIEHNVDEIRDDVVQMVSGIPVEVQLQGYSATEQQLNTRDEILSAMVVYGFLTYWDGTLRIPNKELMLKFQSVLSRDSFGEVKKIVDRSKEMLEATLNKDTEKMAEILEYVHDLEIPVLKYNDENSLACVVTLCYLYARNYYRIERELHTGKGYCDFIFFPKRNGRPGIILELKKGGSCDRAVRQIKEKNYAQKLKGCQEILLVGISYDEKKRHKCQIETVIE